ncbi:hypothetical protein TcasGA2_TC034450 [Tribolium castaneum]|uniref:Uncharacterized protein n=1 Tax=Tribolium castaneum TaxID=7070 RepID=A0A139WBS9_TRICA|nr:hypothetical protein TcasGA2_TC034450 [Tribolium castaneum]
MMSCPLPIVPVIQTLPTINSQPDYPIHIGIKHPVVVFLRELLSSSACVPESVVGLQVLGAVAVAAAAAACIRLYRCGVCGRDARMGSSMAQVRQWLGACLSPWCGTVRARKPASAAVHTS